MERCACDHKHVNDADTLIYLCLTYRFLAHHHKITSPQYCLFPKSTTLHNVMYFIIHDRCEVRNCQGFFVGYRFYAIGNTVVLTIKRYISVSFRVLSIYIMYVFRPSFRGSILFFPVCLSSLPEGSSCFSYFIHTLSFILWIFIQAWR